MNLSKLNCCRKKNKDAGVFMSTSNVKFMRDLEQLRRLKENSERCRKRKKTRGFLTNSSMLVKLKN